MQPDAKAGSVALLATVPEARGALNLAGLRNLVAQ
jgi:hypothetical protein